MNIPEAAIEAARKSVRVKIIGTPSDQMLEEIAMSGAEAAAPIIAAQALREEADRLERMPDSTNTSPYVRAGQHIIQQIRNRAAELEADS